MGGILIYVFGFGVVLMLVMNLFVWLARRKQRYSPFCEQALRPPGYSLGIRSDKLRDDFSIYFIFYALLGSALLTYLVLRPGGISILSLLVVGPVLMLPGWMLYRLYNRARHSMLGFDGELYTGQELNLLMEHKARVFHDLAYHAGNIDHVVVGHDVIYAVETKAVRKPVKAGTKTSKDAKMSFDGLTLKFPHFCSTKALDQARYHASYLADDIKTHTGITFEVVPVVALPGWFVNSAAAKASDVIVMNPKRGGLLRTRLGTAANVQDRDKVVNYLEQRARISRPLHKLTDPDGAAHFNWLLSRKITQAP